MDLALRGREFVNRTFDPLLGFGNGEPGSLGYSVWPAGMTPGKAERVVMLLGGSTTAPRFACWGQILAERLNSSGAATLVLNGAAPGYQSGQELLKLLRDAPNARPHLVISLSGINDAGLLHCWPHNPLLNRAQARLAREMSSADLGFSHYQLGYDLPKPPPAHEQWLLHSRLMAAIASELSVRFLHVLQPTMVVGGYLPTDQEMATLRDASLGNILGDADYAEVVRDFYDGVRAELARERCPSVLDLSRLFEGRSGLFRDYRHQNEAGCTLIAEAILGALQEREWL